MTERLGIFIRAGVACGLLLNVSGAAWAQGGAPDYDFDWVTIGDMNNPAYSGPSPISSYPTGRGSVGYSYRIARTEVTTAQWMEFINTFSTRPGPDNPLYYTLPANWGAFYDGTYTGPGSRFRLESYPGAAEVPVAGIPWRVCAQYCNWLHNGKSADFASLRSGAYDTSTWGGGQNGQPIADAPGHMPGAKFWIPTVDEWIKAAHYDPDKDGPGQGGYWLYPNQSDNPLISGPPGTGQTSAGTGLWGIPVTSYPDVRSAYGLLNLSGGASEWLEDFYGPVGLTSYKYYEGNSFLGNPARPTSPDLVYSHGADDVRIGIGFGDVGLRIVSIPVPSSILVVGAAAALIVRRRS